jgi:TonB family protein
MALAEIEGCGKLRHPMKAHVAGVAAISLVILTPLVAPAAESSAPLAAPGADLAEAPPPLIVSNQRLALLEKEAAGSADLLLELALGYDERRDARSADAYRAAAAQGVGVAELRLGALYETGEGVPQSYDEAHAHYQRAVALGVQEANLRLGLLYLEGWGVQRDPQNAVVHIQRAAEAGYQPAQQVLSNMYFAGVGIAADPKKALEWAERAASDRGAEALLSVGSIHLKAVNVPEDLVRARDWFQLSAEQDYGRGMLAMASTFFRPGTSMENVQIGLRWLDLAAEGGNSAAAFHRAGFYLMDNRQPLTPEAEARARTLIEQAASTNEPAAIEVLELVKSGRSLADAFRFVVMVPYDDRYVQRFPAMGLPSPGEDRVPRPLKTSRPVYPAALRLSRTEGEALVEFVVDSTGLVRNAHIVRSTHPGFAELSVAAVSTWRFEPGFKDGRPVNTRMRIPIRFQLSDIAERPVSPKP